MSRAVVFLHGFLGTEADWDEIRDNRILQTYGHLIAPTLPGHGHLSGAVPEGGLAGMANWLAAQVNDLDVASIILVGYSLGGRILLTLADQIGKRQSQLEQPDKVCGIVIESSHPGLPEAARESRWNRDRQWAQRFREESLEQVLQLWYQQPVFQDLSAGKRSLLVKKRRRHDGNKLADVLLGCSLAKQPDYHGVVFNSPIPIQYWYGMKDKAYAAIAGHLQHGFRDRVAAVRSSVEGGNLEFHGFERCGHNCHLADPAEYTRQLREVLSQLAF